jgi:hypothetical protein
MTRGSRLAHEFRVKLYMEHFGLAEEEVRNPMSLKTRLNILKNAEVEKIFMIEEYYYLQGAIWMLS